MRFSSFVKCFLCVVFLTTFIAAQTTSTEILGTVTDSTGAVVPAARVTLVRVATNERRETLTNASGGYSFPLIEIGEELGELLAKKAIAALGIDGAKAHSYGKAAAVGENGELEHAAALLHPKMGAPVRKVLSKGAALIPSSKKRSGPGTTLDIPLGHKDAAFVRSHFDGMEVQINDAPRANEIMVAVAVTDSGRPLPRVGGLTVAEIKGEDGLR